MRRLWVEWDLWRHRQKLIHGDLAAPFYYQRKVSKTEENPKEEESGLIRWMFKEAKWKCQSRHIAFKATVRGQRAPWEGDVARVTFCCLLLTNERVSEMLGSVLAAHRGVIQTPGHRQLRVTANFHPECSQPPGCQPHGWIIFWLSEKNASEVSDNIDPWPQRERDLNKHIPPSAGPRLSPKIMALD